MTQLFEGSACHLSFRAPVFDGSASLLQLSINQAFGALACGLWASEPLLNESASAMYRTDACGL